MSQKQAKKRRRLVRGAYNYLLERWRQCEPPWWRFISHWRWKKNKPMLPKGVKEDCK